MRKAFLRFSLILSMIISAASIASAQREITREEYIATYAPIAMQHQKDYGIPASIKMAQGILESRYGNSDLSRRSNNHFGIKCKSTWQGDTVVYDDDEIGECFRRYNTVEESYRDHSEFLKAGQRYAFLFDLESTDYKGWAHGLKKAGYATAPHYATSLIKVIEDYELYLLDDGDYPDYVAGVKPVTFLNVANINYASDPIDIDNYIVSVFTAGGRGVFFSDGYRYIVAREGDSLKSLSRSLGIAQKRLRKYNKLDKEDELTAGDRIYIENTKLKRKS